MGDDSMPLRGWHRGCCGGIVRTRSRRFNPTANAPKTMSDTITRDDARALALIDRALGQGRFTTDLVEQIADAFSSAPRSERAKDSQEATKRSEFPRAFVEPLGELR